MSTYKENIKKLINIVDLVDRQVKKGQEHYGHTLDEKPLGALDAINNTQEELIDALFYLENLKDVIYCDTDSIKQYNRVDNEKN